LAQYLMTLALHSDRASKVAPWNYSGAIFSLFFGWIFFGEIIHFVSIIGMIVIGVAVVMNARLKPVGE
jgi:drug/metabolite transporter (DMT)-like permease